MTNIETIKDWDNINNKYKILLLFIYSDDIKDNTKLELINKLSDTIKSKTKIFKLNINSKSLVNELDITSYPCIRLYKNTVMKKEFFIQENLLESVTSFLENHIYDNYC